MSLLELFILSIGLAMDAFAVSICKGLSMKKFKLKKAIIVGLYFGIFHMIMPTIGYFLGSSFESLIQKVDHWIAFVLLVAIGLNMIKESLSKENKKTNDKIDIKTMLPFALATSIDTLAIGISFAFLEVKLYHAIPLIGFVTFIFSVIGVNIGNKFGNKYEKKAVIFGGIILILLGIKILLEHLGYI